ncbi:MAG: hypothetical protein R3C14_07330 [Caldilineaceae bacterium]
MNHSLRRATVLAGPQRLHRRSACMSLLALLTTLSLLIAPLAPVQSTPTGALDEAQAWSGAAFLTASATDLYNRFFSPQSVQAQATVTVTEKFSNDNGSTFTDDTTVRQGRVVVARVYYDNTGTSIGTGVTINTTVPAGFALVPGSTKNCLEPTPGERICNTSWGQGGAINEGAVWSGQQLTIAPTAGLFGQPTTATAGRLEVGRKRYFNWHECEYVVNGAGRKYDTAAYNVQANAGTNVSNSRDAAASCGTAIAGSFLRTRTVTPIDLLGKRYINLHECHYYSAGAQDNAGWNGGSGASNAAVGSIGCGGPAAGYVLDNNSVKNMDLFGNRYLNIHECHYTLDNATDLDHDAFNLASNTSTTPNTSPNCGPPYGTYTGNHSLRVLDLLDTARGKGYIEFKLVANAALGAYDQTSTLSGNQFGAQNDSGTITIVPEPDNVTIDKKFSTDNGATWRDYAVVEQGKTLIERVYYNNTGDLVRTNVTISSTVPAGFTRVAGSTRNCLNPTTNETVCNTTGGQGGAINEGAVWSGQQLNIAPTAGLFGEPVVATSGPLEVGRKRYINLHECQYFQQSIYDDFTTIAVPSGPFATGTNAANTPSSSTVCGPGGSGGHVFWASSRIAVDTLGKRYFNLHECQYLEPAGGGNPPDNIFVVDTGLAGTNASNTPNSAASCAAAWGNHPLWSSNVRALDTRNKRYFNISECQYYNAGTGEDFFTNLWSAPNTGYSASAMTAAGCSSASGFTLQGSNFLALDTYDTARGRGFIEFTLVADVAPGIYDQPAVISGDAFSTQDDLGTITVTPTPDNVAIDKKFSADGGVTFEDSVAVSQGDIFIERIYYNNTGDLVRTGTSVNATVPAGFVRVPGSTRNCLNPAPGEYVCNDSPGQGGAMNESAVWSGQQLTIAPTAGLWGEPVSATSGPLAVGRKRYINIHECQYFQPSIFDDFTTIAVPGGPFATGTNASNLADSSPICGPGGSGGHIFWRAHLRSIDTLGRRYFNLHECQYLEQAGTPDNIFVSAIQGLSGTNASNTQDSAAACAPAWGNHPYWASLVRTFDTFDKRYFNISECQYYNANTGEDFFTNLWGAPNTGYSTTAMTAAGCSNANGFTLQGFNFVALDTYDMARGQGFIEFKLVANVAAATYTQPASLSGSGFNTIVDTGEIAVTTSTTDTDNDTVADFLDPDDDNDGIPDTVEGDGAIDTDNDGIPDSRDLDSDNDGINDVREAAPSGLPLTDANGDGMADGADSDGNGMIDTPQNTPVDSDGDNVPDYRDLDSDNDGSSDLLESGSGLFDAYGDGVLEGFDSDNDGIVDDADGAPLTWGDAGDPMPQNNDGVDLPDYLDRDSDNNGTDDIVEAGYGSLDGDNDGIIDTPTDDDQDGIADSIDSLPGIFGGIMDTLGDADNDSVPNGVEINDGADPYDPADYKDSDGDLVPDYVENLAGASPTDASDFKDSDSGGTPDYVETVLYPNVLLPATDPNAAADDDQDTDGDGVPDYQELLDGTDPNAALAYKDSDGDLVPDYVETQEGTDVNDPTAYKDSDGDLAPDYVETIWQPNSSYAVTDPNLATSFRDTDAGTLPDYVETVLLPNVGVPGFDPNDPADDLNDTDGDGISNRTEGFQDTDGDGVYDLLDVDSDNDGILDSVEAGPTPATPVDTDSDTVPDYKDLDSDNDGIPDNVEAQPTVGYVAPSGGIAATGVFTIYLGGLTPVNTDGADNPDYLDLDTDNDGLDDASEAEYINASTTYTDVNGMLDGGAADLPDRDSDGEASFRDDSEPTNGGIEYKIIYNSGADRYEVYMRPTAQPLPLNQTGTVQVTLKAPHVAGAGAFTVTNLIPYTDTTWTVDSRVTAPSEAPGYDYLSLQVTFPTNNAQTFDWQNGVERLVFSFANGGVCAGPVTLMENNDPFHLLPNSAGTNPGQQIDVFGLGNDPGNDFLGVYGLGQADCGSALLLPVKAFLQGAYDAGSGLMRDELRTLPDFPLTSPYGDGATLGDATLLTLAGNDAIVDWVLVEVRDPVLPTTVITRRAGLLQRDGDVVALDGSTPLSVTLAGGNYYIALRHRNHLGVMTGAPVALSAVTAPIDFTTMNDAASYGVNSQVHHSSGVYLLWMGDVNGDQRVIVAGPNNDRNPILAAVLGDAGNGNHNHNFIVTGYLAADLNLDGRAIAAGPGNDINLLFYNVFTHPANSTIAANYVIQGQAP